MGTVGRLRRITVVELWWGRSAEEMAPPFACESRPPSPAHSRNNGRSRRPFSEAPAAQPAGGGGARSAEDIVMKPNDRHYLLRPETVESYFYLHRLTGRIHGWDACSHGSLMASPCSASRVSAPKRAEPCRTVRTRAEACGGIHCTALTALHSPRVRKHADACVAVLQ
jgi:hypothetical protein